MHSPCTWVIVADASRARCLEEKRRGVALLERTDFDLHHMPDDELIDVERPGRVHESHGPSRHGVDRGRNAHDEEAHRFLLRVAQVIAGAADAKRFDEIIIFAPPKALGVIRDALPESVRKTLVADQAVDVVKETVAQIASRVEALRHPGV